MSDLPDAPDLVWRPLTLDDVDAWHEVHEAARAADDGQEHLTPDDLRDELTADWVDTARDTVLGVDADGVPRAFGLVQVRPGDTTLLRAHCWGAVHPQARGRGVGRALLAWQVEQARRIVADRRARLGDVPAHAAVTVDEGVDAAVSLVERSGFALTRWFSVMRRDLADGGPAVGDLPEGVRVVPWSADLDDAVRLAHNEAFVDHWNFQPWTEEAWRQWESGYRWFRPGWTLVALDGDEVAGYATGHGYEPDWEAEGVREGWTAKLGVRRAWRGRGLARALLARQVAAFAGDGMQRAGLDVDTESLTGADRLYTGLGYAPVHRSSSWSLPL